MNPFRDAMHNAAHAGGMSMRRVETFFYTRLPVLAAVATVAVLLTLGAHVRGSVSAAWTMLGVSALHPLFADTRTITHSIDCLLSGQDPFFVRSFDPWGRVYNYPPIWLDLRYLGVTSHSSYLLGSIAAAMLIAAMLLLFEARSWIGSLLVFFSVLSSAVLFGVERGNCDLAVYSLQVFGFFLAERLDGRARPLLRGLVIVVLTVLKIYPVAIVASLVENRRALLAVAVTVVVSLAALVATSHGTLPLVLANTPQEAFASSYGAYPALFSVGGHVLPALKTRLQLLHSISTVAAMLLAAISVFAAAFNRKRFERFLPVIDLDTAMGGIAVSGLAVFCFTFIRGSSFNYRLIFLLGVVAYLVRGMDRERSPRALPACLLFVLLLSTPLNRMMLVGQTLGIAAFTLSSAWLGLTLLSRLGLAPPGTRVERL